MNRSCLRPFLLFAITLLFAPLAQAQSERVVIHPCIIQGTSEAEAKELQAACFEDINRNAEGVVPLADVVNLRGKAPLKDKCKLDPRSRNVKDPGACLGGLATQTQAERAILITLVLDKKQVTRVSGTVFDNLGKQLDKVEVLADKLAAPARSNPSRADWISVALASLFKPPHFSEQLPGFLKKKRYSMLSIVTPKKDAVVRCEPVPVQAELTLKPDMWPLYPEQLRLTVKREGTESRELGPQRKQGDSKYNAEWTPVDEGAYTLEATYPEADVRAEVVVRVTSGYSDLSILQPKHDAVVWRGEEVQVLAELKANALQGSASGLCKKPATLDLMMKRRGGETKSATLNPQKDGGSYGTPWTPAEVGDYDLQAVGTGTQSTPVLVHVKEKGPPPAPGGWKKPMGVIVAAVGLVGGGAMTGVFIAKSNEAATQFNNEYNDGDAPSATRREEIVALHDDIHDKRVLAGVSAGVGALLVGAGAYLWFSDKPSPTPGSASLSIGPGGVGVQVLLP